MRIAGKPIEPGEDGEFSYEVDLSLGENIIELEAEDVNGNAAKRVLTLYKGSNIMGGSDWTNGWVQFLPLLVSASASILITVLSVAFMKKREKSVKDKKNRIWPFVIWDICAVFLEIGCVWQFICRYRFNNFMRYLELAEKSASEASKYLRLEHIFGAASGAGLLLLSVSILITFLINRHNKKKNILKRNEIS